MPAIADTGFYAELSAGSAKNKAEAHSSGTTSFTSFDGTDTGTMATKGTSKLLEDRDSASFGLRFGYQFNDYIAIELGHHQYGEAKDEFKDKFGDTINNKLESSSTSAGIKAMLPLSDEFSLFARAGVAQWDFKGTITDSSSPDKAYPIKQDDNDIYYGIGAEYRFNESISLGLEYSILDMEGGVYVAEASENSRFSVTSNLNYKVENLSLLLKFSF